MTQSRAKGTRLERIAKRRLEEKGYVVIRAAGSHGPFDLVALRPRTDAASITLDKSDEAYGVLCVQVRANRKPPKKQLEALSDFPVTSEVWVHKDRACVWDIYDIEPAGSTLIRQEPYK